MIPFLPLAYLTVSPLVTAPQDGIAHGDAPAATELSQEAREAMARFTLPEGFGVSLFAAEPLMAHPVAFTIDALGRFYVAETYRHSKGVTDIRGHMDWLEDDLASRTVADRVAMYRKHLSPERYAEEFETESERVVRLVDVDGDGEADESTVFAAGFDDPAAGIGAGLLTEMLPDGGVKIWFTCIPDMWELVDADGDGVAEQRERHSTGYGLRVALLGHDLHGPVIGPYGRLYFSMGDRGFNVETPEGERLVRLGTGAIFRCELDGSGLEVFCDGLRNPRRSSSTRRGTSSPSTTTPTAATRPAGPCSSRAATRAGGRPTSGSRGRTPGGPGTRRGSGTPSTGNSRLTSCRVSRTSRAARRA